MATVALNPQATTTAYVEAPRSGGQVNRRALFLLTALLIVVGIVGAQNMLRYPYYQDSEGTNAANAWSMMTTGSISPYTYGYDEAPVGWFMMSSAINVLTTFVDFSTTVDAGRVFMLVVRLISVALVFGIARKLTRSDFAAVAATLIFAFSPLSLSLGRRLLLDNLMLAWLLGAIYLVLGEDRTLAHYIGSALSFGVAVLCKGAAMYFLPVLLLLVHTQAHPHHRRFARGLWFWLAIGLVSFYPLYAQMRLELFPQGWPLGADYPHVSLLERLLDRGRDSGRPFNIGAGFTDSFAEWAMLRNPTADPVLLYVGLGAAAFVAVMAVDNRRARQLLLLNLGAVVFLLTSGQLFVSDMVLLLPILVLNIAMVIGAFVRFLADVVENRVVAFALGLLVVAAALYPFGAFYAARTELYTQDQVSGQHQAVAWVRANLDPNAVVVADNFAFVELRQAFPNSHHYWKVDTDPDVRFNVLGGNWCSVDYIIATPQVYADVNAYGMDVMGRAMGQSDLLMSFANNGWPIDIRRVSKAECDALERVPAGTTRPASTR